MNEVRWMKLPVVAEDLENGREYLFKVSVKGNFGPRDRVMLVDWHLERDGDGCWQPAEDGENGRSGFILS